jgi:hypothetical protein
MADPEKIHRHYKTRTLGFPSGSAKWIVRRYK